MLKKITLLALVAFSTTSTFIACTSSDDTTEQTQTSYNITPPAWLLKKWILKGASSGNYTTIEFTSNDIRNYTTFESNQSWMSLYESLKEGSLELEEKPNFKDISKSDTYYEAQYTSGFEAKGTIDINWKVYKVSSNEIRVVETSQLNSGTNTIEKDFEVYIP